MMTDKDQNVVWEKETLPFGEVYSKSGSITNNLGFPGQYYDEETGLFYNWHRYYNAEIGRYNEVDPILHPANGPPQLGCDKSETVPFVEELLKKPLSLNPYIYTLVNPQNNTDPDGQITISMGTVIIVITVVLTAKYCYDLYKCFKAAGDAYEKVAELQAKYPLDTQQRVEEFFKSPQWKEVIKRCPDVIVQSYTQ